MKNIRTSLLYPLFLGLLFVVISCTEAKKEIKTSQNINESKTSIKYAKGFDIQINKGYTKLIIKSPYPDAKQYQEFILVSDKKAKYFK